MNLRKFSDFVFENKILILFLLATYLIKINPFYFFIKDSELFSSSTLSRGILLLIPIWLIFNKSTKFTSLLSRKKAVFLLILLYLLGQSLSILGAQDVIIFFRTYLNVIFSVLIFTTSYLLLTHHKNKLKIVTLYIIITGTILTLFELAFHSFFNYIFPIMSFFANRNTINAYMINISLGKYSLIFGNELWLPFFFLAFSFSKKWIQKIIYLLMILLIIYLSILSNFRTRLVVLVFCIISYVISIMWNKKKITSFLSNKKRFLLTFSYLTLLIVIPVLVAISFSNKLYYFNVIDRILLQDKIADQQTIDTRIGQYQKSLDLFQSSPIFGVGLGNYALHSNYRRSFTVSASSSQQQYEVLSSSRPHSIFFQLLGETGLVGTIPFLLLLLYFAREDIYFFKRHNKELTILWAYSISSWSILIYGLINPADSIFVIGWFWFLRGIIESQI